ncbi:hypothetical protein F5X96DRAFT_694661 [Biscogniauxia mediterranea]|nr:hypothetical protein F5X96DRAFT_694661 [Biscogniauxia mediterranea]
MEPQNLGSDHAQQQIEEPRAGESGTSDFSSTQPHGNNNSAGTKELVDENVGTSGQLAGTTSTSDEQPSNPDSQQDKPDSAPHSTSLQFIYSIDLDAETPDFRRIRRAAHLYQEIHMHVRELTYNRVLLDVHEEARSIRVTKEGRNLFAYRGEPAVRRFPRHLFRSEDNARSMLLFRSSQDRTFCAKVLFEELLRPYCFKVFMISLIPGDFNVRIKVNPKGDNEKDSVEDNKSYGYKVFFLTTLKDNGLVFDPSGAQFGWGDVVVPFWIYFRERVYDGDKKTKQIDAEEEEPCHGPGIIDWETLLGEQGTLTLPQGVDFIRKTLAQKAISAFKAQLKSYIGLTVEDFVQFTEEEAFSSTSKVILGRVKDSMDEDMTRLHSSPLAKVIPCGEDSQTFEITTTKVSFDLWKDSWLTEKETEGCKDRNEVCALFRAKHEAKAETDTASEATPKANDTAGKQKTE